MAQFIGRLFKRQGTTEIFEGNNEDQAPDEYMTQFVETEEGDVAFIEIKRIETIEDTWTLWRVECTEKTEGLVFLVTTQCTKEEAEKELISQLN